MIKNIIFDIDKTLLDSYSSVMETFKDAVNDVCDVELNKRQMKIFEYIPTELFYQKLKFNKKQIKAINKKWYKLIKNNPPRLFDGVEGVIKELYSKGYFLGVVTSRTMDEFNDLDDIFKRINKYFSVVVTSDMVEHPKPSVDSMKYIYDKFNLKPRETLYIGDNKFDFEFANNSKCKFIQVTIDSRLLDNVKHINKINDIYEEL